MKAASHQSGGIGPLDVCQGLKFEPCWGMELQTYGSVELRILGNMILKLPLTLMEVLNGALKALVWILPCFIWNNPTLGRFCVVQEYTVWIILDLGLDNSKQFPGRSLLWFHTCWWLVAPLFSLSSIESYAKGLLQFYYSIIPILFGRNNIDFWSTSISPSSWREYTCLVLDWKIWAHCQRLVS